MQPTDPSLVVTRAISVARPPADVFVAMTDPRAIPRWLSSVFDAEPHDQLPLSEGTTVWCSVKLHGQRMRVEGKWIVYEPSHQATFATMVSPIKAQMTITCTPTDDGTLARIDISIGKGVFFGLTPKFVGDYVGRMLEYDLGTLKIILEPPISTLRW